MKKKGQEQTWWIIIGAIIAIIVVILLLFIFRSTINQVWDSIKNVVKGTTDEAKDIDVSDIVGSGSSKGIITGESGDKEKDEKSDDEKKAISGSVVDEN